MVMLLNAALAAAVQNAGMAQPPPPVVRPRRIERRAKAPAAAPMPPPPGTVRRPGADIRMEGLPERLPLVKQAVRAEAQRLYGRDCGKVVVPDRAFLAVEISAATNPEYAVLLGRATCTNMAQRWSGTGGPVVQFWYASDGPARMLLERPMMGFTPQRTGGLVSVQHGTFCPGGAGPTTCLVTYRWNEKDRALEVGRRLFIDGERVRRAPKMRYDYEQISR